LFARTGSKVLLETLAELVMLLPAGAVTNTTTVRVLDVPLARVPSEQVIVPDFPFAGVTQPVDGLMLTKVLAGESVSVSITFKAAVGPLFLIVIL
jgi:hypothetical protein